MKKFLVLLFALAMILSTVVVSGAHYDNESYGQIPLYKGTMTLDGIKEAAYTDYGLHFNATAYEFVRFNPQPGFTGEFWWLFSNDYKELYVFTEVRDTTLFIPGDEQHDSIAHCYHCDSVELWIDPTNSLEGYITDDDYVLAEAFHYRTDPSGFNGGTMWGGDVLGNTACAPYFETAVTLVDGGYDVEWKINCEVFTTMGLTTLERGTEWGIQMMAKNVWSLDHYKLVRKEGTIDQLYSMNSFTAPCSLSPDAADHNTADFDFIKLGNPVGEAPDDDPDETDAPDPDETTAPDADETTAPGDETTAPNEDETTAPDDPGKKPVRPTGDTLAVAAAALILAAGAAIVISKKRR